MKALIRIGLFIVLSLLLTSLVYNINKDNNAELRVKEKIVKTRLFDYTDLIGEWKDDGSKKGVVITKLVLKGDAVAIVEILDNDTKYTYSGTWTLRKGKKLNFKNRPRLIRRRFFGFKIDNVFSDWTLLDSITVEYKDRLSNTKSVSYTPKQDGRKKYLSGGGRKLIKQ